MKQKTLYVLLLAVLFLALAVAGSDAKAPRPVKEGTTPVKPAVAQIARPVQEPATQAAPEQIQPAVPEDISADLLTGEKIDWQVLSSGGRDGNSTNFKLNGTISQTAVDPGSSTNFKLNSGFWQDFGEAAPCLCKPGDANGSGIHNIQNRNNSAIGLVGFLLGDQELIHAAIDDPKQGYRAQMEKGVQSDGVWCEGAWGYHFFTIEGIWPLAEAARNCGIDLYGEKLKSLFDAPFALVMPNFNLPNFNDSGETGIRGHADLYELGYARYHNPGYGAILAQSSRHGSLALYFGVDEIPKAGLQTLGSHNATGSGYAMLRRGADDQATWVCLKYGPHGGGHGHFDKLSFILYARGHIIGVDAGTKRYASPLHKDWDKTTVAHNTLVVDQESQQPAQGKCLAFGKEKDVDFAVADAGPIYEGVRFTRAMAMLNENLVVVVDQIRSEQEHTYDIAYHQRGEWGSIPTGQPWATQDVNGYRRLKDATTRSTADGIILSTDLGVNWRPAIALGAGDKTEIITATGVGKNTEDPVPVAIFRRKTRETAFVWAVALDGAEARFQTLSVCGESGADAPPFEAVAVQVTAGSGPAWTLLVNPDAHPVRASLPDGSAWSSKAVFSVR